MQNSNLKTQNDNLELKTDLRARSYKYALSVIRFIDKLNRDPACYAIRNQLIRSATSVGANIIEAKASSSRKDFINFFTHALKSANESKFWLGLLRDSDKSPFKETQELLQETIELANMLGASIITLKGKRKYPV